MSHDAQFVWSSSFDRSRRLVVADRFLSGVLARLGYASRGMLWAQDSEGLSLGRRRLRRCELLPEGGNSWA